MVLSQMFSRHRTKTCGYYAALPQEIALRVTPLQSVCLFCAHRPVTLKRKTIQVQTYNRSCPSQEKLAESSFEVRRSRSLKGGKRESRISCWPSEPPFYLLLVISHYHHDISCKNQNYIFEFVKVMPKVLSVPFFPRQGVGVSDVQNNCFVNFSFSSVHVLACRVSE